jgi:hypothetical protein
MLMTNVEQFKADRREALMSLNKEQILAYLGKYDENSCTSLTTAKDTLFWKAVHKAITGAKDLPMEFRRKSKAWLAEHRSASMDDGDL